MKLNNTLDCMALSAIRHCREDSGPKNEEIETAQKEAGKSITEKQRPVIASPAPLPQEAATKGSHTETPASPIPSYIKVRSLPYIFRVVENQNSQIQEPQ